jgi:hypothetical protein
MTADLGQSRHRQERPPGTPATYPLPRNLDVHEDEEVVLTDWMGCRVVRQPITYAVLAGVMVNLSGWSLPGPVAKASQLLAGGAVAAMLLLVGLQLARLTVREEAPGATLATAIRLLAVPPIAWAAGRLVGLEGMAFAVAILQASTPTSVSSALWALEFDARSALASAAVVLSTVASVVTLTVLLAMLTLGS